MMRQLLTAAALAALALPTATQGADAAKVRAAYEQLCTGAAPGSLATCAALRLEVEKAGVPGTVGWSGLLVGAPDDGTKAVRVFAVDPGGPGAAAGLRTGDMLVAVDGQPFSDAGAFIKHAGTLLERQQISVRVVRGDQILDLPLTLAAQPKPAPKLNSERTERGAYSVMKALNGVKGDALTLDKIRVGEAFHGVLEDSDASSDWGKREDCLEVSDAGGAKNLAAFVTPNGAPMRIYAIQGRCAYGVSSTVASGADGKKPFGINFATQAGVKSYLMVSGAASAAPYQVIIREQTPKETLAWREQVRRNQIAAQQQREAEERAAADRRQMWGAALQGLIIGATGAEMPAMRADGSMPNMLDTLNAANAAMERKNAESAARLNETIARAQAQADWQRREQAAEAEAEAQAKRRQQAQKATQDRQAATIAFGNARAGIEQRLREAAASGDRAQLAHWQKALKENDALAGQYGVTDEVRQYAQNKVSSPAPPQGTARTSGEGQLGQTPVGGFPAPTVASSGKPAPPTAAGGTQGGAATLRCFSPNPDGALVCPQDRKPAGGVAGDGPSRGGSQPGQAGGSAGGGSGGGGGQSPPVVGPRPPARPPVGGTPPGVVDLASAPIWREGITLCEKSGAQAQFGNWRCTGPLQMNYVNFEKPNWMAAMKLTCGGDRNLRDLGVAGGYRAFGCGFPISPNSTNDIPARFGVGYIPSRMTWRCPKGRSSCVPG